MDAVKFQYFHFLISHLQIAEKCENNWDWVVQKNHAAWYGIVSAQHANVASELLFFLWQEIKNLN